MKEITIVTKTLISGVNNMSKNYFSHKKIWNASNIVLLLFFLVFALLILLVLIHSIHIRDSVSNLRIDIAYELILWGGFLLALIFAIHEIWKYNYLVDNGLIVTGKVVSAGTRIFNTTMVAVYFDEKTQRQYKYVTGTQFSMDAVKLQQYIENYPEDVRIMIDPQNYKRGVILIEEYCDRMAERHKAEKLPIPSFYKNLKEKRNQKNDE